MNISTAIALMLMCEVNSLAPAEEANHDQNSGEILVYIGTYTSGKSEGIYVYRMNKSTGELKFASVAKGIKNPSYLFIHPQKKYLYAVSEASNTAGKPRLHLINQWSNT